MRPRAFDSGAEIVPCGSAGPLTGRAAAGLFAVSFSGHETFLQPHKNLL